VQAVPVSDFAAVWTELGGPAIEPATNARAYSYVKENWFWAETAGPAVAAWTLGQRHQLQASGDSRWMDWSASLSLDVRQGQMDAFAIRIPAGLRLLRVRPERPGQAREVFQWHQDGETLHIRPDRLASGRWDLHIDGLLASEFPTEPVFTISDWQGEGAGSDPVVWTLNSPNELRATIFERRGALREDESVAGLRVRCESGRGGFKIRMKPAPFSASFDSASVVHQSADQLVIDGRFDVQVQSGRELVWAFASPAAWGAIEWPAGVPVREDRDALKDKNERMWIVGPLPSSVERLEAGGPIRIAWRARPLAESGGNTSSLELPAVRLLNAQVKKQWFIVTGAVADLWTVQSTAAETGAVADEFAKWSRTFDSAGRTTAWIGTAPEHCVTLRRKDAVHAAPAFVVEHGAIDVAATQRETRGRSVWVIQGRAAGSLILHLPPGMEIEDVRIDQHSFPEAAVAHGVLRLPLYLRSMRQRVVLAWRIGSTKFSLPTLEGATEFPVLARVRAAETAVPNLASRIPYGEYMVRALERKIDDLTSDWDRNRQSDDSVAPDAARLAAIRASYLQAKSALGVAKEPPPIQAELDAAWRRYRQAVAKYNRQSEADALESTPSAWSALDDPACIPQAGAPGSAIYFASDQPWSEFELVNVGSVRRPDASSLCRAGVYAAVLLLSVFADRFRTRPWLWLGIVIGVSAAWLTWGEPRWASAALLAAGGVAWRALLPPRPVRVDGSANPSTASGAK
jgi:hypothetical protein